MNCSKPVNNVLSVSRPRCRLGDAEINHLGHRHAVVQGDQDVRWLDVAMNDAFLVRMLDGMANLDEQFERARRCRDLFWSQ